MAGERSVQTILWHGMNDKNEWATQHECEG